MGFWNDFPYTNFHELNLDWILKTAKEAAELAKGTAKSFEELKTFILDYFKNLDVSEEVNAKLAEMATSGELANIIENSAEIARLLSDYVTREVPANVKQEFENTDLQPYVNKRIADLQEGGELVTTKHYLENFRYYVDGVNGSDTNDGLSEFTAFKTLGRLLNIFNEGACDVRCYILSGGLYEITKPILTNATLHVTGNVDNVQLYAPNGFTCYTCHLNFNNIAINVPDDVVSAYYFEGCVTTVTAFTSNQRILTYGGTFFSNSITAPQIFMQSTNARFINTTNITTTANNAIAITADRGCFVTVRDSLVVNPVDGATGNSRILNVRQSTVNWHPTLQTTPLYKQGLHSDGYSTIFTTKGRLTDLTEKTLEGNYFGTPTMVITENFISE